MEQLLGFSLDIWDYVTFVVILLCASALVAIWVWLAGLPGRIALARRHPEAEAVKLLGYTGLLPTVVPWIQAFIWAFKPTDIIDIRRFPRAEAKAIDEEIARLSGEAPAEKAPATPVASGQATTTPSPDTIAPTPSTSNNNEGGAA